MSCLDQVVHLSQNGLQFYKAASTGKWTEMWDTGTLIQHIGKFGTHLSRLTVRWCIYLFPFLTKAFKCQMLCNVLSQVLL